MHEALQTQTLRGVAAPILIDNLDTDQIMPKQFLRIITKQGLDRGVLYDLRFHPDGSERKEFILNQEGFRTAKFIIGRPNFGCGSSREHAVWGLQQLGIEAVIAPSFGEIFFGNALNNRLLLIVLPQEQIDALLQDMASGDSELDINLQACVVSSATQAFTFPLAERHRKMIVEGLDMVGATLQMLPAITEFEEGHHARHPWADALR
jgi:3-isopropylmalate/(R)-2-methylmalate dehydratase small subunit